MVLDASILVTSHKEGTPETLVTETLYPSRHQITLPLNGLNNIFKSCETAFNYHTKLDCDR